MAKSNEKKDYYFTDTDYLDNSDACSANECTGLIPNGYVKEKAIDAYNDVYEFGKTKLNKSESHTSTNKETNNKIK